MFSCASVSLSDRAGTPTHSKYCTHSKAGGLLNYSVGGSKSAISSAHPIGDNSMVVNHPDQERASYLLNGLRNGFCIGYNYNSNTCQPCRQNMYSAALHPHVVEEYLSKECSTGKIVSPRPLQEFPFVQISPFGVIPKSTPGN